MSMCSQQSMYVRSAPATALDLSIECAAVDLFVAMVQGELIQRASMVV